MIRNTYLTTAIAVALLGVSSTAMAGKGKGYGANLPGTNYDFRTPSSEKVELGRNQRFDKILSGNLNISCGTCYHSLSVSGDGLSLPVGEGGSGLGVTRNVGSGSDLVVERVPRNAPPVFNLGDNSIHTFFHDGRVSTVGGAGFPSG